jgi:hypothetical protein
MAFVLFLTSCQSFKQVNVDPSANAIYPGLDVGDKIKVFKVDGGVHYLIFDRVEGGEVIGKVYKESKGETLAEGKEASVKFSEISKIEVRKFSIGKTLLIPGGVLFGFFVLYLLAFGGEFQ